MSHQEADGALGYTSCQHGLRDSQNHLSGPFGAGEVYAGVDSGIGGPYQRGGGACCRQRGGNRMIRGLQDMTYKERLKELGYLA